jgi:hypothetical protein
MNPQIMLAAILARDLHENDRRRADEWRRWHRQPDVPPLAPEPERGPSRWSQVRVIFRRVAGTPSV